MAELAALATAVEGACGSVLETVSGGNSANLPWAFGVRAAGRINDLRLGESILLGIDPISGRRIDGLFDDAFALVAEVIESRSGGKSGAGFDAVTGRRVGQSILALGYQDTDLTGLAMPNGLTLIGGTSDHLVVGDAGVALAVGAEISFRMNYAALMRAMNAPDIRPVMAYGPPDGRRHSARLPRPALELT